jgi:bacterioferritin-associated ferredoxin
MKALTIGLGSQCPKCHRAMERRQHKPEWKPRTNYWFEWWDYCVPCRHVQHYEVAKVWQRQPERTEAIREQLGEQIDAFEM